MAAQKYLFCNQGEKQRMFLSTCESFYIQSGSLR